MLNGDEFHKAGHWTQHDQNVVKFERGRSSAKPRNSRILFFSSKKNRPGHPPAA